MMKRVTSFIVLSLMLLTTLHAKSTWKKYDGLKWDKFKEGIIARIPDQKGWCPLDKAEGMMQLIHDTKPELCVEIGVYGGSSILPTASALKFNKKGSVYAIDPWSNLICCEGYEPDDPNYTWWSKDNLQKIYKRFVKMLAKYELNDHCKVLKMTSKDALGYFDNSSIDILHIDGSHTADAAMFDAVSYLPKVKSGGYIWFDDIHWSAMIDGKQQPTTMPAVEYLLQTCEVVEPYNLTKDFALLRKK